VFVQVGGGLLSTTAAFAMSHLHSIKKHHYKRTAQESQVKGGQWIFGRKKILVKPSIHSIRLL
jgi:hypothetical protein